MSVVAMIHVIYDDFYKDEVLELAEQAAEIYQQQPGFLGMRQYQVKSREESPGGDTEEVIVMTEWDNEYSYEACRHSPNWLFLMPQWSALQEDGDLQMEIKLLCDLKDGTA